VLFVWLYAPGKARVVAILSEAVFFAVFQDTATSES